MDTQVDTWSDHQGRPGVHRLAANVGDGLSFEVSPREFPWGHDFYSRQESGSQERSVTRDDAVRAASQRTRQEFEVVRVITGGREHRHGLKRAESLATFVRKGRSGPLFGRMSCARSLSESASTCIAPLTADAHGKDRFERFPEGVRR